MHEGRKAAWATRRIKYGEKGHNGDYSRTTYDKKRADSMEALIIKLHIEGILSEGQAVAATCLDRIAFRAKVDAAEGGPE